MSLQASAYGRLGGAPRAIETKNGKPMAVATLAVDVGDDEGPPLWLGIVAFGKLADLLLRHAKGDLVSASGRVQVRRWTDTDGSGREQLQLVADALVSARTVRPAAGRTTKRAEDGAPFDDALDG